MNEEIQEVLCLLKSVNNKLDSICRSMNEIGSASEYASMEATMDLLTRDMEEQILSFDEAIERYEKLLLPRRAANGVVTVDINAIIKASSEIRKE